MRGFPKLDANAVRVYGVSDDLIEVEGGHGLDDEFSGGEKSRFVGFTDGTVLRIRYGANDGAIGEMQEDVEGVQDKAVELGVLEPVHVTEACGPLYRCVEFDNFPGDCFRYPASILAAIDAAAGSTT